MRDKDTIRSVDFDVHDQNLKSYANTANCFEKLCLGWFTSNVFLSEIQIEKSSCKDKELSKASDIDLG